MTEFGDTAAPRASVTKATRRWQESGLSVASFVTLVDDVATMVRSYRPTKPMAYFFTALENLLRVQAEDERETCVPDVAEELRPTEADAAWRAVLEECREVLTPANYRQWLASTHVVGSTGDVRQVAVPEPFHKFWLEQKFARHIRSALDRAGFDHVQIQFVVAVAGRAGTR